MSRRTDPKLNDRLTDAAKAREALLAKFKQSNDPDNPKLAEQRQKREAIAAGRAVRAAEREVVRQQQERERAIAEAAAAEAARLVAEQEAREAAERAEQEAALLAEQKAERDRRYAARKAAKKQRRKG
jgi:hypothetical protein